MARPGYAIDLHLPAPPLTRHEPLIGRGKPYPHPKTKAGMAAWQAVWLERGRIKVPGPITIEVYVRLERPASHRGSSNRLTAAGRAQPYPPRFDLSNVLKLVEDALKGLAFGDDSEIIAAHCSKRWVEPGYKLGTGTFVEIRHANLGD